MYYDIDILNDLMSGEKEPENRSEDLFVIGYKGGLDGDTLFNICIKYSNMIDSGTVAELQHFIAGYAFGQNEYETINEDFNSDPKGHITH